jgi:14-3-3 protein epsilon
MSVSVDGFGEVSLSNLVELVRIAETAERYEDMCRFVRKLVEAKSAKKEDLDVEERNLLSVAFKNVVGSKRAAWRTLSGGFEDAEQSLVDSYKVIVEKELETICKDVLALLTEHLLVTVKNQQDETEVFYLKMCGDYYRYLAEFRENDDYKENCKKHYEGAMDVAKKCLAETHPTRLGLALNFSVCYYEILKEPEKACKLAKQSFDDAIEKLDTLNDASYKDSTLIMQLLRDNLTLWTSEQDEDEQDA